MMLNAFRHDGTEEMAVAMTDRRCSRFTLLLKTASIAGLLKEIQACAAPVGTEFVHLTF